MGWQPSRPGGPASCSLSCTNQTHKSARGREPKPTAVSRGRGKYRQALETWHITLLARCSPPPSRGLERVAFLSPYLPGCSQLLLGPCQPFPGSAPINRDRDSLQLSGSGGENSSQHSCTQWSDQGVSETAQGTRRAGPYPEPSLIAARSPGSRQA